MKGKEDPRTLSLYEGGAVFGISFFVFDRLRLRFKVIWLPRTNPGEIRV